MLTIGRAYRNKVRAALRELGISEEALAARNLPLHAEATRLAPAGLGTDGRDKMLAPAAAKAWSAMRDAARADGITLLLISGFRSVEFQTALIRHKLKTRPLDDVLRVNAPPGYSEHHTGCAIDLGTEGCAALDEAFERTAAFEWLVRRAAEFGFALSYPRENRQGFLYEPWHWCFRTQAASGDRNLGKGLRLRMLRRGPRLGVAQ